MLIINPRIWTLQRQTKGEDPIYYERSTRGLQFGTRPKYAQSELGSSRQKLKNMDAKYANSLLRGFSSSDTGFASSEPGLDESITSSDSETDKQSGVTEIEVTRKVSDSLYVPIQSLIPPRSTGQMTAKTSLEVDFPKTKAELPNGHLSTTLSPAMHPPATHCLAPHPPATHPLATNPLATNPPVPLEVEEVGAKLAGAESTESETESSAENSLNFEEIDASTER